MMRLCSYCLAFGAFIGLAALPAFGDTPGAAFTPDPPFAWEQGRLIARHDDVPTEARAVVDRINARDLDAALDALETITGPDANRLRAELALAVAGNLDNQKRERALELAEGYLHKAIESHPDDPRLLRSLNQLTLFRTVPDSGMPTNYTLLPARDLIREGKLEEGLQKVTGQENEEHVTAPLWALAAMFEGKEAFGPIAEALQGHLEKRGLEPLLEMLRLERQHPWAAMAVREDSLLYPRVLLERMRAYYWWWRQMGDYRPMAKQGFQEVLEELTRLFPEHDLIRMYRGEQVPWGEGFRPDPAPEGAPGWAVNQRELRARVDYVVEWWFLNRQAEDGSLGGGWEDDCEVIRRWAVTAICCGNPRIEAGIAKLVDGIWNSGQLVNGYDKGFKDVEHSSEMAADTSVMIALDFGDPLYFERFLATTKTTRDVHTGVNGYGHRHFKAMKMSATEVAENPQHQVDAMYCGRAMRPAAMVAWYSHNPRAVALVHDWALAWSEDTWRAGKGKSAFVMPAVIGFADDNVDGPTDKWWDPGLGNLYDWRAGRIDMVLGKILGAWDITRDPALLIGARSVFNVLGEEEDADTSTGSIGWVRQQLRNETTRLHGMYFAYGAPLREAPPAELYKGYVKYRIGGDPSAVEAEHAEDLNAMRFNLPMITSEVRGTDRVDLRPMSLLGPLTGSPVSITEPPSWAVTWRGVDADFTALVESHDERHLNALLYSFSAEQSTPYARMWRLNPGRYTLRLLSANNSHVLMSKPFDWRQRPTVVNFDLPPRLLCRLEISQEEDWGREFAWRPDLAINARDVTIDGGVVAGKPCAVRVVVHNIGSSRAESVKVILKAYWREEKEITSFSEPTVVREIEPVSVELGALDYPFDLEPKTAVAELTWTPLNEGVWHVFVEAEGGTDLYSGNNGAGLEVRAAPAP